VAFDAELSKFDIALDSAPVDELGPLRIVNQR
jgi:hypothetical protein